LTSASGTKAGPSARIGPAWFARGWILFAASGGIEIRYCAHGDAFAASFVATRSQSVSV